MSTPDAQFAKCSCQHCNGHIEFDASLLAPNETLLAECPHCKLETTLFVPPPRTSPVPPAKVEAPKPARVEAQKRQQAKSLYFYDRYFYKSKDGEKGPYTLGQLRSLWTNGQITADAMYRTERFAEWLPLDDSPILSVSNQLAQYTSPLRAVHNLMMKGTCLLSLIAFFLTNVSVSLPIFGNVNVSMFDFLTPKSQTTSSEQTAPKPNIQSAFDSRDSFQLKKTNAGAIICAVAVLGLMLHYLLTLVWGMFAFMMKETFSVLNKAWLWLAVQFPILFSIGSQMVLMGAKSEFTGHMRDDSLGSTLGAALVNHFSIQPGVVIWILMILALAAVALPIVARKMSLPWEEQHWEEQH